MTARLCASGRPISRNLIPGLFDEGATSRAAWRSRPRPCFLSSVRSDPMAHPASATRSLTCLGRGPGEVGTSARWSCLSASLDRDDGGLRRRFGRDRQAAERLRSAARAEHRSRRGRPSRHGARSRPPMTPSTPTSSASATSERARLSPRSIPSTWSCSPILGKSRTSSAPRSRPVPLQNSTQRL